MGVGKFIILHKNFLNQQGECQLFVLPKQNEHFKWVTLELVSQLPEYLQIEQSRESFSTIPHLILLFSFNSSLLLGFLHCLQMSNVVLPLYPSANLLVIFRFPKTIASDLVLPRNDCFLYTNYFLISLYFD